MENLVIDLEYAKKLKEIGVIEKSGCLYAKLAIDYNHETCETIYSSGYQLINPIGALTGIYKHSYPAFLTEELIKILPVKIFNNETLAYGLVMSIARDSTKDFIVGYYRHSMKECYLEVRDDKLSNALAKLLIELREKEGEE